MVIEVLLYLSDARKTGQDGVKAGIARCGLQFGRQSPDHGA